jgi:prophage antirepressor-like protein
LNVQIAEYNGQQIRFLEGPGNEVLLNTKDVCRVLDITERPDRTDLSQPSLDLASAIGVAAARDEDFALWLDERFVQYNPQALVRPNLDDDWNFT